MVRPRVVQALDEPVDLLVVAVKAPTLQASLERIAPTSVEGAIVLPLLNGLEHLELLRSSLPAATVVAGSIGRVEVVAPEPGVVEQRTPGALVTVGSDRLSRDELRSRFSPLLAIAGIDVVFGESERAVLWEKAARLAVLAAATVASGGSVGALREGPMRDRMLMALTEACAVARADGVELSPTGQLAIIDAMAPSLTTSTARDVAAGRPSELDAITGAVVRAGRRHGVATPELAAWLAEAEAVCRAR